ncbi:ATP-binding protein [Streptomyces longispororuber]|uniref:ATP-binding protein n=1 Tax=Streptomyces longispororuber TaxID=68230 RepID=UPI00340B6EA9
MTITVRAGTHYQQRLAAEPAQIRRVRRITAALLRYWGWGEAVDPALVCVTELLANVDRHVRPSECELRLAASPSLVRIVVSDGSRTLPVLREPDPYAEEGRGMLMIAAVAHTWGADLTSYGKAVWVELHPAGQEAAA